MPREFLACLFGLPIVKLWLQIFRRREDIGARRHIFIEGCLGRRRYKGREGGRTSEAKQAC